MRWSLPNVLTLLRIALIPVFVAVFYLPVVWAPPAGAAIFALAGFTDWLDGYLARRLNQMSSFGAFLDPVADKLMVVVALMLLVQFDPTFLMVIPALVIVGRELTVSALREWMAGAGAREKVSVSVLAKYKTTVQMVAITTLLFRYPLGAFPTFAVGLGLLWAAATLTLWSMVVYLRAAWPLMNGPQAGGAA